MKRQAQRAVLLSAVLAIAACCGGMTACEEHIHQYGEWKVTTPATCEEAGVKTRTCLDPNCKAEDRVQTEAISPRGHNWGSWKTVEAAHCTTGGTHSRTCLDCGKSESEATAPLGHDWDEGIPVKGQEATCTKEGRAYFTCNVCNYGEERDVGKLPHTWRRERTKNPTCEEAGENELTCTVCGTTETEKVDPLGHSWNAGTVTKAATCTAAGVREQTCSICGKQRTVEIGALGHNPEGDYTIDVKPSFEHGGSKSYHCLRCGEHLNPVDIPKLEKNTPIEYEFRVLRNNGDKINDTSIKIEVFDESGTLQAMSSRTTLKNGIYKVELLPKTYRVRVSDLPAGYSARGEYTVEAESPIGYLYLTASPISDAPATGKRYQVGDVMHDFTVETVNHERVTLSALLQEKKMVLINFFYVSCPNCQLEFPGMERAYREYSEDVAIIAIDPSAAVGDSENTVRNYAGSMGFTFHVVWDDELNLQRNFGVSGYPVSVVVDKEGVVAWIHTGGYFETDQNGESDSTRLFCDLFAQYTSDEYWRAPIGAESALTALPPDKRTSV